MKKKDLECKAFYPSLEEPYKSLFEECQYPWEALPKIKTWISAMQEKLPEGFQEVKKGDFIHETAVSFVREPFYGKMYLPVKAVF